jgi:NAD(P)-dependent dehydrogenase (short-subunit alcohol dehydrogenase family)
MADDRFGLAGTASIVTGGGSGIGRACATLLAELGSGVCVVDRQPETAAVTVKAIEDAGGEAFRLEGDAREAETAEAAAKETLARYGRIDVLVNNVGGMFALPAAELTPGGWSAIVRLNLDPPFLFSRAVAPAMLEAGKGSIVNVASIVGATAAPKAAHYGAAKAGVISLTRTLALEWAPAIRVNCVAPDYIATEGTEQLMKPDLKARFREQIPLGRAGRPEDVANAVAFLASDLAAFVTGETLLVDGGMMYRGRLDVAVEPDR